MGEAEEQKQVSQDHQDDEVIQIDLNSFTDYADFFKVQAMTKQLAALERGATLNPH